MKQLFAAALLAAALAPAAARADKVEEFWTAKCKSCHGPDGKGITKTGKEEKIADMTTDKWAAEWTDEKIKKILAEGSKEKNSKGGPSKMKAFGDKMKEAGVDADQIIKYIRGLKK